MRTLKEIVSNYHLCNGIISKLPRVKHTILFAYHKMLVAISKVSSYCKKVHDKILVKKTNTKRRVHSFISKHSKVLKKVFGSLTFLLPIIGIPAAFSLLETSKDVFTIILVKCILLAAGWMMITYICYRLYLAAGGRSLFDDLDDDDYIDEEIFDLDDDDDSDAQEHFFIHKLKSSVMKKSHN